MNMDKNKIFIKGRAARQNDFHFAGAMRNPERVSHKRVSAINESGLVSIVIVTTITIILALMTISFTKIMNRNLREAIDLELSTQAHYAAESGLNDARQHIAKELSAGRDPSIGPQCLDLKTAPLPFVPTISGSYSGDTTNDNTVKYTCVLINSAPKDLLFTVPAGKSVVFKMTPANASQLIAKLYFSWQNQNLCPDPSNPCATPQPLMTGLEANEHRLPQESGSGGLAADATGLLRTAIYPWPNNNGNPANNDELKDASRSYFMYPNANSTPKLIGTVNYGNNGVFVNGECNEANISDSPALPSNTAGGRYCNSLIDNIAPSSIIYVKLTAVYQDLNVSVQGAEATGTAVPISGAQAVIDVTGEGNDVLKRIQARSPLTPSAQGFLPQYAIQSMDTLCKRLRLPKIDQNTFGDAVLDDPANGQDRVCLPQP